MLDKLIYSYILQLLLPSHTMQMHAMQPMCYN